MRSRLKGDSASSSSDAVFSSSVVAISVPSTVLPVSSPVSKNDENAVLPTNSAAFCAPAVGVLLPDAVLYLRVEPVPTVVLADPCAVRAVRQPFPPDVVGARTDMFPANDDLCPLRAFVALVAVQRDGFLVHLDLVAVESGGHVRSNQA